jgi:multidrug efflux pump subunit AcrA (membrane-fusion protein)
VIYPSAAAWKRTPDITEGATVRKDQVLLLMPDLTKMQVKVGIHESIVDRIKPGMPAKVTLPEQTLTGKVSSVASVTKPAGWWTGNVVKYDTIIELPSVEGLKPGMSAEVEVIMDRHDDVVTIPVAAVVETAAGDFCWVKTPEGPKRRSIRLGDTDDSFVLVEAGVKEGDEVVLNPIAFVEEAQSEVLKPLDERRRRELEAEEFAAESSEPAGEETDHGD